LPFVLWQRYFQRLMWQSGVQDQEKPTSREIIETRNEKDYLSDLRNCPTLC
jgi:hypothetical protein